MFAIRTDGRFHVVQDESAQSNVGTETAGWLLGDEFEMSDSLGIRCPDMLTSSKAGLPGNSRLRYANWGKGLALPSGDPAGENGNWWAGAAEQNCWTNGVDLDSVDLYWFTDPYQGPSTRYGYLYGENIRNLAMRMPPTGQCTRTGRSWRQAGRSPRRVPRARGRSCRPRCARPYGTR